MSAVLRAWLGYILAFELVSIPLRAVLALAGGRLAPESDPRLVHWVPQFVAGVLLLPVSFLLYRRSVRRLEPEG